MVELGTWESELSMAAQQWFWGGVLWWSWVTLSAMYFTLAANLGVVFSAAIGAAAEQSLSVSCDLHPRLAASCHCKEHRTDLWAGYSTGCYTDNIHIPSYFHFLLFYYLFLKFQQIPKQYEFYLSCHLLCLFICNTVWWLYYYSTQFYCCTLHRQPSIFMIHLRNSTKESSLLTSGPKQQGQNS